ncbi:MAG: hypothetical protein HY054_09065 [Proteobacteria bacterium]|nr:hypothetical protein [Pseudomonadota bacterium]
MADTLTVSLPGPLADEVRAAAEARRLTPEEYVRQQLAWDIALGADNAEDQPGVEEDQAAFDDFQRTGMGVPWEEVRDWMKSWGTANELPRPQPRKLR